MSKNLIHRKAAIDCLRTLSLFYGPYGEEALKDGIEKIKELSGVNTVLPDTLKRIKWERDVAISQLKELGIGLGQKTPDMVEVVRCKDCIYKDNPPCCPCQIGGFRVTDDWYCPMGVKENEAD